MIFGVARGGSDGGAGGMLAERVGNAGNRGISVLFR